LKTQGIRIIAMLGLSPRLPPIIFFLDTDIHRFLLFVLQEMFRVLKPGGILEAGIICDSVSAQVVRFRGSRFKVRERVR